LREGTCREDLSYRINVIHIHIPPLRHRLRDIPLLTEHLIKKLNQKMNKHVIGVTPETLELLQRHHWPGNVRELENVLERAMHLVTGVWIEPHHLPDDLQTPPKRLTATPTKEASISPSRHKALLAQAEKQLILD